MAKAVEVDIPLNVEAVARIKEYIDDAIHGKHPPVAIEGVSMTKAYIIKKCDECSLFAENVCYHPKTFEFTVEDIEDVPSWCHMREESFWMELDWRLRGGKGTDDS